MYKQSAHILFQASCSLPHPPLGPGRSRCSWPPCSELHFCNGLAFTFVRKLGVGLSFEAGHGFVIRKIYTGELLLGVLCICCLGFWCCLGRSRCLGCSVLPGEGMWSCAWAGCRRD